MATDPEPQRPQRRHERPGALPDLVRLEVHVVPSILRLRPRLLARERKHRALLESLATPEALERLRALEDQSFLGMP